MNHDEITNIVTRNRTIEYGVGILPNPYAEAQPEFRRRREWSDLRQLLTNKIEALQEPRFITPIETSECLEALITMTDSRKVIELGMCTGVGTLHMLRAIVGKPNAYVVSVDARPAHDRAFFSQPKLQPWFRFVEGWTPQILDTLQGEPFDFVFVDSDHSVEHCEIELAALWKITKRGTVICFHDVPERQSPQHPEASKGIIFSWLHNKVAEGALRGPIAWTHGGRAMTHAVRRGLVFLCANEDYPARNRRLGARHTPVPMD
jgi:predicted O-methyltransferase YrrM